MRMRTSVGLKLLGVVLVAVVAPAIFAAEPVFMPADVPPAPQPASGKHRVPPPPPGDVPPPLTVDGGPPPADLPPMPETTPTTPVPPSPEPPAPPTPPTTPTTGEPPAPPSPPTTPTTMEVETGPVTVFGPKNPLALRYPSKFPPVVQVKQSDGAQGTWTAFADHGSIKMVKGLFFQPFITFTVTGDQISQAAAAGGGTSPQNKIDLVTLFSTNSEKPLQPPAGGATLKQPKVSPLEKKLLLLGRLSARSRWLFHKADGAANQVEKVFWGLQIKILSLYVDKVNEGLLNSIWDEIDGDLIRGAAEIRPGHKFDTYLGGVGVFLMYHDDDLSAFRPLCKGIDQRLKAEMNDLGDYPPDVADARKAAIQKRIDANGALLSLIDNG